jgi:deoxyadenosine/deoxycytidine kinase
MFLFTIEGNIGSGKSTFLNLLKDKLKHVNGIPVVFVEEPVSQWETIQSEDGKSMIELFYSDKKKYAFSFQIMAYISRLHCLQKTIKEYPDCILISERSLLADYNVFAKMLYEDDMISHENYQIYTRWFHYFAQTSEADGIIYLKTEPEVCYQRCISRNRKGEEEISLEYLTSCSEKHDEWLCAEFIPTIKLTNNDEEQIDLVKDFIEDEMEYMNTMNDAQVDEYVNKNNVYICSVLIGFIGFMYMIKFGWMVDNVY